MPTCAVTRRVHFNAAHRLHNPAESDAWNRATFGPCNNANYHGHNYELEVTVEGPIDPKTGYVLDIAVLKALVDTHVSSVLDHRNLNLDVPYFREHIPSAENIAVFCWQAIAPALPAGKLHRVRLWETPRNYVEYSGS
ncbi:MAG: 6-carboxytetrahydropterin synthase [Gemmatimonadales bacterium]|jgi:6-pyruvoyltetrahydropterin/6-carboxytetrahydropterin synthase|nr:MAG: 6-carboxytetrahydropterin synthase [Gemmatimonadales bacterium]